MKNNSAFFLDRDGVINTEKDYVYRVDDFDFIDGIFDACQALNKAGYKIIIITNQAGIGRGYYTEKDFSNLTHWMLEKFKQNNVAIEGVYFCPHHPTHGKGKYLQSCTCRKPEPGMLHQAALEHNINLKKSFLVGDKISDIKAGQTAGVGRCFFVKTGKPIPDKDSVCANGDFNTLLDVVNFISS